MEVEPWVIGEELLHAAALVGREVVQDDVDLPPASAARGKQTFQESRTW